MEHRRVTWDQTLELFEAVCLTRRIRKSQTSCREDVQGINGYSQCYLHQSHTLAIFQDLLASLSDISHLDVHPSLLIFNG